ncbi:hypothetical protein TcWFU_000195 [Taenia crassiceps]|uniref:Tetraspanin n=1 Tax=Taenia crassiceps TaxID=6207 RepID=A0ABR4QJ38_9CEST
MESQMRCTQISVIALAAIYLVLGANVFGVGVYVAYELKFMPAYEARSVPMVAVVVATSVALIIISLFGCVGALLRKPWMLGTFSLLTTILALVEIGIYLTIVLVANENASMNETSGNSKNTNLRRAYNWLATLDNTTSEVELSKKIRSYAVPFGICVNFLAALQIFSGVLACAVVFGA